MKKVFYVLSLFLLVSCSDSETIVEVSESDIAGTWDLTSLYSEVDTKLTYEQISQTTTSTLEGKDISSTFTFTENPNEYNANGSMTIVAETSSAFGSQSYEYETESINELENGDWRLEGDILILTANGQDTEMKITSFEDNKMILKQSISESYTDDGASVKISGSVTLKFER